MRLRGGAFGGRDGAVRGARSRGAFGALVRALSGRALPPSRGALVDSRRARARVSSGTPARASAGP